MTVAIPWLARMERFDVVESTNDVVGGWLEAGCDEVCVAVADEQTAGRGRNGRTWSAPRGAALLSSLGFRPSYLDPSRTWQLAAIVSLAMAGAAERVSGTPAGTVRLKWPNDLVVSQGGSIRKLAGVLGETIGVGSTDPRVVIGIGVNAGWQRAGFPPALADGMTSVAELASVAAAAAAGHAAGADAALVPPPSRLRDDLLDAFLDDLEPRVADLRSGRFPAQEWQARQLTSGSVVRLERPDGTTELVRALDVDADSGALVVESLSGEWPVCSVTVGEISHLRVAGV